MALSTPSGFTTHDELYASRFRQGGRTVYSLDLSPHQLTYLVPRPNPDLPVESNREIRAKHADNFSDYFIDNDAWVIPGIILRSREPIDFKVEREVAGTSFGTLRIPRTSSFEINTLDGQHRTLGFFIARDKLVARRERAVEDLHAAQRQYPGTQAELNARMKLDEIEKVLRRFEEERFAVQIYVESDPLVYRQMFYDIADNALGITAAVRARFDSRKVVNRALPQVLEHPLLVGRLEREVDRLPPTSDKFLTIKNVSEIVKNTVKGLHGRMSKNDNKNMSEDRVAETAIEFLDLLTECFPPLKALELGQTSVQQLRETSLLGSWRFLRVLAGVYHELLRADRGPRGKERVATFFKKLAPHASSDGPPVRKGTIWLEHMPEGAFIENTAETGVRGPDLTAIYHTLLDWEVMDYDFLS